MIHTYSFHGLSLALDVFSGSVHTGDEQAIEIIRLCETLPFPKVREILLQKEGDEKQIDALLSQIKALKEAGKLYSEDVFKPYAEALNDKQPQLKALCLHVAHSCNLRCSYCFAGQGRYHGKQDLMSEETGRRALDYLVANSGKHRNLDLDFFGGEPLLNWETVKKLVLYGRSLEKQSGKHFRFTLTTNGVLLDDEVIDFCNEHMHNVVLSLDGRQQTHDRFRVDAKGRGSYANIVPKFQRFVEKRGDKSYYVRGTYTRHNLDFFEDIIHMADLGFTQLSMEPVVVAENDPAAIRAEDLPFVFNQYEKLAIEMDRRRKEGRPIFFYHYNIDLEHGPCAYKRLSGCGSGTEYLAVTPQGELYPCHQFVGEEEFRLGDLKRGILKPEVQRAFASCNLYAHPECENCWAKFYCSGGCAANAYHASGSLNGIYPLGCSLFKKRIECALWLKAAEEEDASSI